MSEKKVFAGFRSPDIVFGRGAIESLGDQSRRFGTKALLCLGSKFAFESGLATRLEAILAAAGIETRVLSGIPAEPTLDAIDRGLAEVRSGKLDFVIAVGGGSVIDVAKVVAGVARETGSAREYHAGRAVPWVGAPFVACPTTAGTGSEATRNAVITDPETKSKRSIRGPGLLPELAIVDPELCVSMSPPLTAYTGMDALTQAVESFVTLSATPLTRALSLEAARLLVEALPRAYRNGSDMEAREHCSYGSLMSGLALSNAGLGIVHGVAHPVGAKYHAPHGLVCGIMLPWAIRFNQPVVGAEFERLSAFCEVDILEFVETFLRDSGMKDDWAKYRVGPDDMDWIVAESMPSGSLKGNPRKVTEDDVAWLLKQVATR